MRSIERNTNSIWFIELSVSRTIQLAYKLSDDYIGSVSYNPSLKRAKFIKNIRRINSKMTPLETNRRILTWLCIYPVNENASEQHKILRSLFGIGVFVANLMVFIVSIVFLVKFASTDIEEALFSVIQLAGTGNILYVSIIIFIVRHKIVGLFKSLDKIYEERKIWNVDTFSYSE